MARAFVPKLIGDAIAGKLRYFISFFMVTAFVCFAKCGAFNCLRRVSSGRGSKGMNIRALSEGVKG